MNDSSSSRESVRERLLELDQSLREAFERRDGEMARGCAQRHFQELRSAAKRFGREDGAWIREAADRLRELVARAEDARDALGAEISGNDVRRKLVGAPVLAYGGTPRRTFRG